MKQTRKLLLALALAALWGAAGCGKSTGGPEATTTATPAGADKSDAKTATRAPSAPLTPAQLAQFKPNEVGLVPILEYHSISPTEGSFQRSITNFRHDLNRLYQEGYRPVGLEEYLDNRIALPAGTSPVIFTFDDARGNQFWYLPDGKIDPNCGVGILEEFHAAHPDFAAKATFFVLPDSGFDQKGLAAKKMQALLAMGFEIGNHTVTHDRLDHMPDDKVKWELATCVAKIQALAPQAHVDTLALPYGIAPHNRALLASGTYQGHTYENRAVLLVGADPAPSPVSMKFKPMRLPRIQACEQPSGSTFWLNYLQKHPSKRYVSDGDPNTITVPAKLAAAVDKAKLQGATLRTY